MITLRHTAAALVVALPATPALALIDFNPPLYELSDVLDPANVFPRLEGQDGWTTAFDQLNENRDAIVSNQSLFDDLGDPNVLLIPEFDGFAVGNVGPTGVAFSARATPEGQVPVVNGNTLVADFLGHDFDNDGSNNSAVRLYGWVDTDGDGELSPGDISTEMTMGFGLDDSGQFALRGSRVTGEGLTEIQSGVSYEPDKWYRITLSWSDPLGDDSRNVTMGVVNLTDDADLGNIFDNQNVSANFFGPDPSTYDGISIRLTEGLIDNILESGDGGGDGLVGDLNGDGFVGAGDLDILLGVWNQNDSGAADLNDDGFIGAGDLDILLGNWNAGTPPTSAAAVPEPASLALLTAGTALLMRRRA